jgi:hypothetical protein
MQKQRQQTINNQADAAEANAIAAAADDAQQKADAAKQMQ